MSSHWGPPPWKLLTERHCTWKQLVVLWPIFSWLNLASWPKSFLILVNFFFHKKILLEVKSLRRLFFWGKVAIFLYWVAGMSPWKCEGCLNFFHFHILFIAKFGWFFIEMIANSSTSEKWRKEEENTGSQCPLLIFMLDTTFPQTTQT
jgi:hypothetical protein